MNFLFPYMARWKAVNWSRYQQIFTRLAKKGHHVYVLQPPPCRLKETSFQEIEVEVPENLHLIDVSVNSCLWNINFPVNKLIKKGCYTLASIAKANEIIREKDIDVLFLYNIPQLPLMPNNSCIKIFDIADDYIEMLKHELGKLSNPLILNYASGILDKMISKADITLVISHGLAEAVKSKTDSIKMLPNGADVDNFRIDTQCQRKYSYPVVGFIGAFEYFIDFELILNSAEVLPHITFLMVGSGREFDHVKKQKESRRLNNIILTGAVPHSKIGEYISQMDICLNIFKKIPISHNACPIKLFEYLIMKKPVISTRLKEIEKIEKRFVFFADTSKELINTINMLLENKNTGIEYAQRGYETVIEEYTWDSITDRLVDFVLEEREKRAKNWDV